MSFVVLDTTGAVPLKEVDKSPFLTSTMSNFCSAGLTRGGGIGSSSLGNNEHPDNVAIMRHNVPNISAAVLKLVDIRLANMPILQCDRLIHHIEHA
ncbi:hypothetical protein D3C84_938020 [compost metagenome]